MLSVVAVGVPGRWDGEMATGMPWPTLFTPAPWAFAIWGVIYAGEVGAVVAGALDRRPRPDDAALAAAVHRPCPSERREETRPHGERERERERLFPKLERARVAYGNPNVCCAQAPAFVCAQCAQALWCVAFRPWAPLWSSAVYLGVQPQYRLVESGRD